MISSVNNAHIAQSMSQLKASSNTNSKASEEANESVSEKAAEAHKQNQKTISNHTIDSYA